MSTVIRLVNTGLGIIVDRIRGVGEEPRYAHWGEGDTPASATDTALEDARTEETRVAGSSSKQTTTTTGDTYRVVATITAQTNPAEITEFGLFNAASSGTMFVRATFPVINVAVGDAIQFTLDLVGAEG